MVSIFYYQGERVRRAREALIRSHEAANQLQQFCSMVKKTDDAMSANIADTVVSVRLQNLGNFVSGNPGQTARLDSLKDILRDKPPGWGGRFDSLISALLAAEDLEFKNEEKVEQGYWQRNRIMLRGGVIALFFGLLVLARTSDRRNRRSHQLESHLRENDILIRAIMDGGKHAIVVVDRISTLSAITFFNHAAERMVGYEASRFFGKPFMELMNRILLLPELEEEAQKLSVKFGRPVALDEIFELPLKELGFYEREWTVIRKDRTTLSIFLTLTALREEDGEMHGFLAIFQDISERKEIDRIKNEFISTISHELRTPLTSIRAALGLLDANARGMDVEKVSELISMAQRNSERLVKITNDILDVEKIGFGKLSLNLQPLDADQFIREALEMNKTYGHKYHVRFIRKGDACEGVKVVADPDRLMQVMTNLLSNAAKFSAPDSEVWVSAERLDGRVHFSIRDFGSGIPETFRESVFKKFSQANPSNTREHEGSGLGLNISKQLVEAMDGQIRFETADGKGTTFFFDLPQQPG